MATAVIVSRRAAPSRREREAARRIAQAQRAAEVYQQFQRDAAQLARYQELAAWYESRGY